MSLKGTVGTKKELCGSAFVPKFIQGKSAYEIAVANGFEGTEEEWLESLKADFDERADEARESLNHDIETVILPEAKTEIESAKTEAVEAAVNELGRYTTDSKDVLEKAGTTADEKEVLLWENTVLDPDNSPYLDEFTSRTLSIGENMPSDVDKIRIVFVKRQYEFLIIPSITVKLGDFGCADFVEDASGAIACTRRFSVNENGNIMFEGGFPDNSVCIPYRIYGVRNIEVNLAKEMRELLADSTGDSETSAMSQKAVTEAINEVKSGYEYLNADFVIGRITAHASEGVLNYQKTKYAICTANVLRFDRDVVMTVANGYTALLAEVADENLPIENVGVSNASGFVAGTLFATDIVGVITIPANRNFFLRIQATPLDTSVNADIELYRKQVTIKTATQEDIDALKGRVSALEITNADHESRIENLEYYPLADYWTDYLNGKQSAVLEERMKVGNHGDCFSFFTDYHTEKGAGYTAEILKHLQKNCHIRKHFFGGDIHNSNVNADAIELTEQFGKAFDELDLLTVLGNHEVNVYSETETNPTESEIYSILFKHLEDKTNVSLNPNLYYTYDNKAQKIRYIVLNTHNASYRATVDDTAQINWLYDKLSELEDGWSVVVLMHMYYGGVTDDVHTTSPDGEMVKNICDALNNRGTYSDTNYAFDFANAKANVIGIISGHTHRDYSETSATGFPIIAVGCDAVKGSNQGITRKNGTTDEHKIDLFFVDTTARTIKTIRIGAGDDREWSY